MTDEGGADLAGAWRGPMCPNEAGVSRRLSKSLRGARVFGKENPGVGPSDVSVFLRWRPVQISLEHNLLPQLYVPRRRLLGDSKVLDSCVARQPGNGKWREKGNGVCVCGGVLSHSVH